MINSPVATSGERRAGREGAGLLNAGTRLIPRVLSRDPFFISQRERERALLRKASCRFISEKNGLRFRNGKERRPNPRPRGPYVILGRELLCYRFRNLGSSRALHSLTRQPQTRRITSPSNPPRSAERRGLSRPALDDDDDDSAKSERKQRRATRRRKSGPARPAGRS